MTDGLYIPKDMRLKYKPDQWAEDWYWQCLRCDADGWSHTDEEAVATYLNHRLTHSRNRGRPRD